MKIRPEHSLSFHYQPRNGFETSISANYRSFRLDRYPTYYDPYTLEYIDQGRRERIPIESDLIDIGGYLIKRAGFFNTSWHMSVTIHFLVWRHL
jgi:hypothetical protein